MNRRHVIRSRRDDGATLLLVLIIMSAVCLVMSVILAQADTAERTTIQLRDQASDNYGADAATQAVLNALKSSGIDCSNPNNPAGVPFGTVAAPFYSPVSSEQGPINAYIKCTPDALKGTGTSTSVSPSVTSIQPPPVTSTAPYLGQGDATLPTYAVLTTGSSASDFGLDVSPSAGANTVIYVENGSVGSNKAINATGLCLNVRLSKTTNSTGCGNGTGIDTATNTRLVIKAEDPSGCIGGSSAFRPTPCNPGSTDVAFPPPPDLPGAIVAVNPTPQCVTVGKGGNAKVYAALSPGLYTDVSVLNAPCSGSVADWEWLKPGAYYFNYGSTPWQWPTRLIAGTPLNGTQKITALTDLPSANASPGACDDPGQHIGDGVTVAGAQLVFGGSSTIAAATSTGSAAELCASTPSGTSPPVSMYALTQDQSVAKSGAAGTGSVTVPAESIGSASLINTAYNNNNGHAQIYIKGYVYAPTVQMVLRLENSSGQVFNWGVVVRDLRLRLNGSSPTQPVFDLPKPNTGVGIIVTTSTPPKSPSTSYVTSTTTTYTIRYINVWVCTVASLQSAGATQCPSSGITPNVQARVLTDPSGVPVKVLSWAYLQ